MADQPLLVHLHRAPRRRLRQGQHVGRQRRGCESDSQRASQSRILPLYGDDLALGLLAVEQSKWVASHRRQLLFQQKRGHRSGGLRRPAGRVSE